MTAFRRSILLVILLLLIAPQIVAGEFRATPQRLYLVGDSTVSLYSPSAPTRGWGMYLQDYFKDTVKVVNRAAGGRSSKSFQREGLWGKVLRAKPNFVLIQFGHNDAFGPVPLVGTQAEGEYRECLQLYARTSRKIGATPIFVTPMQFRSFNHGQFKESLVEYAEVMRRVAAEEKVPLIDLHYWSGQLFAKIGEQACEQLGDKAGDHVHFNELGARAMAELVIRDLRKVEPRLAAELRPPTPNSDRPSEEVKNSRLAIGSDAAKSRRLQRTTESTNNSNR